MDKEIAQEIISAAINRATSGRVESIKDIAPDQMMTSEQVQGLNFTKEAILEAFLQDPCVISAECHEGKFQIVTSEGTINFNFVFGDEGEGVKFEPEVINIEHEKTGAASECDDEVEKFVDALFDFYESGQSLIAENIIENAMKNPDIISAEFKDGQFHFQSKTQGYFTFKVPFIKVISLKDDESTSGAA
ncbi:MAG: hypothetical protein HY754_07185 [Nitrospirae bacterium]|nr:hypothetical protein [Nitrospirota bacterium]